MSAADAYLDAINDDGSGVCVCFHRVGDHYRHVLQSFVEGQAQTIVSSVDDLTYDEWPISPPYQQLREVADGDGHRSLLLVGSAAFGHWSASIRMVRRNAGALLEFDIAVRLHRLPAFLGMTYEAGAGTCWVDLPGGLAMPMRGNVALWITAPLERIEAEDASAAVHPLAQLKAFYDPTDRNRRLYLPTPPLPKQFPATYRWRYHVAAAPQPFHAPNA
jgi:hypothetical protein